MIILLKTLTERSVIPAGINKGKTVRDLMKTARESLYYSYFMYGGITFKENILRFLKIKPEDRLIKPGKDPAKFGYYRSLVKAEDEARHPVPSFRSNARAKAERTIHKACTSYQDHLKFSKMSMQWRNQHPKH